MRRRAPIPQFQPAPADLKRYTGPWTVDGLVAWLEARAAWREQATEPLPRITALERAALTSLKVPRALVAADRKDSK